MHKYPHALQILIRYLKRLPGIGTKTAERFAFHLLEWKEEDLKLFSQEISLLPVKVKKCIECGALIESTCSFCTDPHRQNILCIVSSVRDIFLIEGTGTFHGIYQVTPLLSPIHGKEEGEIPLETIKERIEKKGIKEIILALDSTLEGDATSLYLKEHLSFLKIPISRLAFGLAVGSALEHTDEGTLVRALLNRQ